jgi:biotin carboxylase
MFLETLCFQRFEYPSRISASVQERMGTFAQAIMAHIGYDNGFFNLEFIYDQRTDSVATIEINPRMTS